MSDALRAAAKRALEVLENDVMQRTYAGGVRISNAAIALRAALAQEEQEPISIGLEWKPCVKLPVTVHVREQRPEETHVSTREGITPIKPDDLIMRGIAGEEYPIGRELFERTYRLGEAQSKQEQEPVGWLESPYGAFRANPLYRMTAPQALAWKIHLYTHPCRVAPLQEEQTNPWRDAVDHELLTLQMVASDDPRESIRRLIDWHCAVQIDPSVSSAAQELIERGKREALAQEEQQGQEPWEVPQHIPFATAIYPAHSPDKPFLALGDCAHLYRDAAKCAPLYPHPPRREWRGLTEEEMKSTCADTWSYDPYVIARAIEAALKERNHE